MMRGDLYLPEPGDVLVHDDGRRIIVGFAAPLPPGPWLAV